MLQNLLRETEECLEMYGKTSADVRWVGSSDISMTWEDFVTCANIEYDDGYGSAEVAEDLKIVGDGWWLERYEDDGFEWWQFKQLPVKPAREGKNLKLIRDFKKNQWTSSLLELNSR